MSYDDRRHGIIEAEYQNWIDQPCTITHMEFDSITLGGWTWPRAHCRPAFQDEIAAAQNAGPAHPSAEGAPMPMRAKADTAAPAGVPAADSGCESRTIEPARRAQPEPVPQNPFLARVWPEGVENPHDRKPYKSECPCCIGRIMRNGMVGNEARYARETCPECHADEDAGLSAIERDRKKLSKRENEEATAKRLAYLAALESLGRK